MQLQIILAAAAWSGPPPSGLGPQQPSALICSKQRSTAVACSAVYGRGLGRASTSVEPPPEPEALRAATLALSTHDKLALKTPSDPMGAIEDYYDEYMTALRDAVEVLSEHSSSIMLGIMGDHPAEAVDALRAWQQELSLPQPPLRMLDSSGEGLTDPMCDESAIDTSIAAPTYLKFNSMSEFNMLKPHEGPFRGVIITANLREGSVRQYAGLPLALFCS